MCGSKLCFIVYFNLIWKHHVQNEHRPVLAKFDLATEWIMNAWANAVLHCGYCRCQGIGKGGECMELKWRYLKFCCISFYPLLSFFFFLKIVDRESDSVIFSVSARLNWWSAVKHEQCLLWCQTSEPWMENICFFIHSFCLLLDTYNLREDDMQRISWAGTEPCATM